MAGRGPAPKANRQRKNVPARGEWVDLAPLEAPILSPLPDLVDETWCADTQLTWDAWRADPVTAQWSPADIAYAMDTIRLHHAMTAQTASEVRLRMDALGLTPKGKRDLRWRISETKEAEVVDLPEKRERRLRAV